MEWLLPGALKRHRKERGLSMRALGSTLDVSHSTIADWEHARSYPSSFEVQRLAEALGVSICDLYGVQEGHSGPSKMYFDETIAPKLVEALRQNAERIEIHVHRSGDWQIGESVESADFTPTKADRDTRAVLEQWADMSEEQRQEWLDAGRAIRKERNDS